MKISILSRYLVKSYLERLLIVLGVVCVALVLSNIFDILNKTRGVALGQNVFLNLVFLKLPYLLAELLPIITMLSMFIMCYILSKYGEISAIWSNGHSVLNLLLPMSICVLIIGIFSVLILNPVYTHMLVKYENIQSKLINRKPYHIVLSGKGVIISETIENVKRIFIVKSLDVQKNSMENISIIVTDSSNNYLGRINTVTASIEGKFILCNKVTMYDDEGQKSYIEKYQLPTNLSMDHFVEGIKPPHHLNFWQLPDAIYNLKAAGLPILKHQIYFYKILFRPLNMLALVIFAAIFISYDNRSANNMSKTVLGIFLGAIIHLLSQTFGNIFAFSGVNPMLSIALPTLIVILLSSFAILHLRID